MNAQSLDREKEVSIIPGLMLTACIFLSLMLTLNYSKEFNWIAIFPFLTNKVVSVIHFFRRSVRLHARSYKKY